MNQKLVERLKKQYDMKTCLCCKRKDVEWHHVWGRKIEEIWSIVSLCVRCHRGANGTIKQKAREHAEYESIMRLIESGFENLNLYQKPMDQTWKNRIRWYTKHYKK